MNYSLSVRFVARYTYGRGGLAGLLLSLLGVLPSIALAHALFDNPAGIYELEWRSAQINATYATGVFNTMGLRVDNDPSRARVVDREVDGEKATLLEGIALAFDVDDAFAFNIDRTVIVSIELDTTNLTEFFIAYDRNGGPNGLRRVPVNDEKTGWQTFRLELPNARFANRGYGGTDFAIAGGIDLSNRLLTIRNIKFSLRGKDRQIAEAGIIELIATETDTGDRIAVQVGLYDERARMPLPSLMAIELQVFDRLSRLVEIREELDDLSWPHANRYSMYIDGFYRARIPAGTYALVVTRGPEFEIHQQEVVITEGETTTVDVSLAHTLDMPKVGWYSGDVHNHVSRANSAANGLQMAHARAQNLHMHWLNELGNSAATHFSQFAYGDAGEYQEQSYFIASAQEDPRTDYLGHMLALGQNTRIRRTDDYLRYDLAVADIQAAEGIAGIAHMDFAQFWQDVALALLAPEGKVDFVEVMQFNSIHGRDWYRFLNMGFELPAAAGSDWPYMALPGSVRTYVKIEGELSPDTWKEGLKAGRSFVSNGPMLSLDVDNRGMGDRIDARPGDVLPIRATANIEPTRDLLEQMDLIVGGEVVASVVPETPQASLTIDYDLTVAHGTWVAVQAHGVKSKDIFFQGDYTMRNVAHSSPVYVAVNGLSADPVVTVKEMDRVIERLEWFKTAEYARNDNEIWESPERTAELVSLQKESVVAWVDRIIDWYEQRQKELQ